MSVPFYRHDLGPEEAARLAEVLRGSILTTGSYAREAEEVLTAFLGLGHGIVLDSCTAALHLALVALGVGPGDEVITTPMTFAATANAVYMAGGRPVFVDVEPATGNMDATLVEAAITPRTRAILPVHLYGQMCDMHLLNDIARRHNLALIEDAAHCLEGEREGIRPGELGDCACFSFYATKNITCCEGGMLACNDGELARKVRLLSCHGIDRTAYDRYGKAYAHWDMVELGWKYNLDNLRAALLAPQVPKIREKHAARERLCRRYEQALDAMGLGYPRQLPESVSAHHLQTVWVNAKQRDTVLLALQTAGVGVAVNYRALPELTFFREQGFVLDHTPHARDIGRSTLTLPLYPSLTGAEQDEVLDVLKRCINNIGAL